MPLSNEHSCRLKPPNYKNYSRKNCYKKHEGKCIDYVFGIISEDKSELQSMRYKTDIWTEKAARDHCKDKGGIFEPAQKEEKKNWYEMKVKDETVEISIFDEIGGWGLSVTDFKKDFDEIKNNKKIKLLLNSPGGSVFDGMAIYNLLVAFKSKISVEVIGLAASIASVIALAGHELIMGEGSYLMIHNPRGLCLGTAEDMRKVAEVLEKMAGQIANIYTNNSGLDKDDVLQKMSEETWFTAEEALEAGFADKVRDHGEPSAIFDIDKYNYAHAPRAIYEMIEKFRSQDAAFENGNYSASAGGEFNETGGEELKTLTEILEALSELTEEERAKATGEDKKKVAEFLGKSYFAEYENKILELGKKVALQEEKINLLLNEKQEASKELATLKGKIAGKEKIRIIEQALSEGRITPKNRVRWEEQYDKDPDGTKKLLAEQEPVVDLSVRGTGAGGNESDELAEGEGKAILNKMGYSEKEIEGGK